jgi:hypothetical protein
MLAAELNKNLNIKKKNLNIKNFKKAENLLLKKLLLKNILLVNKKQNITLNFLNGKPLIKKIKNDKANY